MAEVSIDQTPKEVRDLFNKGCAAFERGNLDYAVELLTRCVEMEPGLLRARKYLRAAQITRSKKRKLTPVAQTLGLVTSLLPRGKVVALMQAGKGVKAMRAAEQLLSVDPLNAFNLKLFAQAADSAGCPEAAIQTLEIAREHFPDNTDLMLRLGKLYAEIKNTKAARALFEKLAEICPNDQDVIKQLKDSMALDSIATDGWADVAARGGTFREIVKDTEEAVRLEQESKAVKSDKDADDLIATTLEKIEREPGNINHYRALARLYVQRRQFDEAIETLARALEANPGDPEIERNLGAVKIQAYDNRIDQFAEAGDDAGAEALLSERNAFVLSDLEERVRRYPNDLTLRYELAVAYLERERFTEAIQQLQLSQRSPKHRVRSLYFLALCFKSKSQFDLAMEQLRTASSEIPAIDGTKKDVLYEMGVISDLMGDHEAAIGYFKQIYQVDIGFRDVAERVEKGYR